MTDCTTLPLEAHNNRSVYLEQAWNIGRAYRNQAMELIAICQLLSRLAPPKLVHEDAELRSMRRACDLALRSAADSGTDVTDEANRRFKEAIEMLSNHSERRHCLDLPLTVYSKMEIAKWKDSVQRDSSHMKFEDEWGPTMTINFVLLRSPLLTPHDSESITVSQELSANPSLPEIIWNFSRYKDYVRITLEQNPHFYLRCPADESAYTSTFRRQPVQDTNGALEHNDTAYVLFDRPCRLFLDTEPRPRIFGNVWSLNGILVFRDSSGVLEGEQLVKGSTIRGNLWYCEQPVVYHDSHPQPLVGVVLDHRWLRPIFTTLSSDPSLAGIFEDWTVLSRPALQSINIHIYRSRGPPVPTSTLGPPPPPPTFERPNYLVYYTTINSLDDDILLGIFNCYRLDDENNWNVQLGWCKLSHVCQRWRNLVYYSAFHLGMHILCTKGNAIVDTLDHLPPLPLFIDYRYATATISEKDKAGIYHALKQRDRIRRISLRLPISILPTFLMLMGGSFPVLTHLSLSSTVDKVTTLMLPKTFLAPNLHHLTLLGVGLPKGLSFLSTVSLVTLALTDIRASGYFLPGELVTHLRCLPQLADLSIGFSVPIPRPNTERELLGERETPVTLLNLKHLAFLGVGAYLDHLIAQIRAPVLEQLSVTFFNQIDFTLPHLSRFVNITEQIKPNTAEVSFGRDAVSIIMEHSTRHHDQHFILRVMCKQLDWQIDCAAQVCSALTPVISGVEKLTLNLYELIMPTQWQSGAINGTTWHQLLRPFIGVKQLHICNSLSEELSRALEVDEFGLDPGLLPDLQDLVSEGMHASLFSSFIQARRAAGRPVNSSFPPSHPPPPASHFPPIPIRSRPPLQLPILTPTPTQSPTPIPTPTLQLPAPAPSGHQ
ncbi:hypothetical protein V8E53_004537 [Lactarius tabidus]